MLSDYVSSRRPFGLTGYFINDEKFRATSRGLSNPIICYGKGKTIGYVTLADIPSNKGEINKWKLYTPRANNIGTELNDDNLNTFIGEPNTICTESYIMIGAELNLNAETAASLSKYLKTKFARFMHSLAKVSQDATSKTYRFVPLQDFSAHSDIDWSKSVRAIDTQLYAKYGLSDEDINFIEDKIKPMD